jgi:choline dehydrogenase
MAANRFTYVVVGAGAAGCVVANRLSADPSHRVLLLEAGPPDTSPLIHLPVGFTKLTSPKVNWRFETVPQRNLDNRRMYFPQGRTLGGSTSINAMIYIRGNRQDYDHWRDLGNKGWGYDDVLPYFRKSENNERLADEFHGTGGPLDVSEQLMRNELTLAFVRANQELGLPFNHDFNGAQQDGVGYYDVTLQPSRRGRVMKSHPRRESTATAFLRPARRRPNLTVLTHATATRVRAANGRAVALEYLHDGSPKVAEVEGEIILSGGAVNSPKVLLLSGIGPAEELQALGIDVVHDLPGVGKNLQDHMDVYLTAETAPVSYNEEDRWDRAALHMIEYLAFRTGPMTAVVAEAGAFVRSSDTVAAPDIQIHCLPAYVIDHGRQRVKGHGVTINTCNLRPRSIGSVTLQSADPLAPPAIDPNFLDDRYDWDVSMSAFEHGRAILATSAFSALVRREYTPGAAVRTPDEIRAYIRQWAKTDYHPVGSCKMGHDEMAVVDTELRVRGIDGLRVVDASIMPTLISGNTMAPSIMIGEKGAAHILSQL